MFGVGFLAILAVISSCYAVELNEDHQLYVIPQGHLRERRSPQVSIQPTTPQIPFKISGGGSEHQGAIRLTGEKNVFDNGKTAVDVNGFVQRDYMRGYPSENRYGAGATVTQNLYKGKHGEVDVYGGYRREWNTQDKHNAMGGVVWRF